MSKTVYGSGFQGFARKNAIINGDMRIAQKGTSFAAIANNDYSLDRWPYGKVGVAVHTITQDSSVPNDQFNTSLKLDCTTADASIATGDFVAMLHRIEGYNFKKFVGQTATFSFWVKAGKTGTMCVSFTNGGADRSYISEVTINSADTWEKKTVTLDFDDQGGTWYYTTDIGLRVRFTLMAGTIFHTTPDTWTSGNKLATANQTNFVDNTDSTCNVWITGVQLELGSQATDFDFMDFATELARCQRYYHRIVPNTAFGFFGVGATTSTAIFRMGYHYPVEMREAPTFNSSGSFLVNLAAGNKSSSGEALTGGLVSKFVAAVDFTVTGATAGEGGIVYANNDANAYMEYDSEL